MADSSKIQPSPDQDAAFDQAFERLQSLVDLKEANELFPQRSHTVYTACVVLWMLTYQRLRPDASLENAVKHLIDSCPEYLPENKRLDENKLSRATGSYSVARSRLPLEVVRWFSREVSDGIISTTDASLGDRRVFLIDGTTMKLAPEKELQKAFPPASNQSGEGIWPIALVNVFHELSSGCALLAELGPMYGPKAVSETELACRGFENLPTASIVMGDKGYGIFGVAYQANRCGHSFLFRMKKADFLSLQKKAELIEHSEHHKTHRYRWTPTKRNRQTNPSLSPDAHLEVRLHEVSVTKTLTLYLVTNLPQDAWSLAWLFERRYDVEIDIRNFKVVMDAENIRAKSVDTFMKEFYTSVVAYNLTGQLRREAAKLANLPPRRLSFKRVWTTFQTVLLQHMHTEPASWRAAYVRALKWAMKDKLPNRPGRSYEREAYRKRPKNLDFKKRGKPPSKIQGSDLK